MKTDRISRIASLFLIFLFLYNDVNASVRALYNWDSLPRVEVNKTKGFNQPAKQVPLEEVLNTPMSKPQAKAVENELVALETLNEFSVETFEESARIGLELHMPINDPRDDIFHFQLPEAFEAQEWSTVYLNYEVKGVADGRSLAKSINSQETFGERNLEADDQWHVVREKLSPADLQAGANYLRFTVPNGLGLSAEVKNISIDFKRAADLEIQSPRLERVVVDDPQYFRAVPSLESTPAYRLREVEMPALPQGIINVTAGAKAYQPSAKVAAQADLIGFKLNIGNLNSQQKLSELQVYYFDYQSSSWQGVAIDSIDGEGDIAFVPNKGQTQYFGALIKSPEMPEASAFAPTMIQDIEAANPASGMNLMQPPSISRTGEAAISYPLQIPAGRKGMQPQLALSYNSDGGSSWVGYGWNIGIPSISVDTKWGVPTYDAGEQSEQYVFNGQALFEEGEQRSNRSAYSRDYDAANNDARSFYLKVNSSYQQITRYGTSPDDYWWEVVDGSGTITRYGKYEHSYGGVINLSNAVVEDPSSVPGEDYDAQWMITEIEDKDGNLVTYEYDKIDHQSSTDARQDGVAWYIKSIYYTGFNGDIGKYKVEFNYKSGKRNDAMVNLNYGFKKVDDLLLDNIRVVFTQSNNSTNELIKYKFEHVSSLSTQFKEMLKFLAEYRNGSSTMFYQHEFSYHEGDINFGETETPHETISINNLNSSLFGDVGAKVLEYTPGIDEDLSRIFNLSPLGSSSSHSHNIPFSFGVGYTPPFWLGSNKNFTFNFKAGGGWSNSQEKSRFQDVNGDGLADLIKVENRGSNAKLYYYPLQVGTNGLYFGARRRINEPGVFASSNTQFNVGYEALADLEVVKVSYGRNWNYSNGTTEKYLIDYNSDGILDLVKPEGSSGRYYVYFGKLDNKGNLSFSLHSAGTYNPILQAAALPDVSVDPSGEPFMGSEIVMSWEAPATGVISVSGTCSHTAEADGPVEVAIQKNETYLLSGFQTVEQGNPVSMAVGSLSVTKGDTLYFRIRSEEDSYEDLVHWDPQVAYTSADYLVDYTDGAGNNYGNSSYSDGFLLSGKEGVTFGIEIPYRITWPSFELSNPSDSIEFRIRFSMIDADDTTNNEYEVYTYKPALNGVIVSPTPGDFVNENGDPLSQLSSQGTFNTDYTNWSTARQEATSVNIVFEVFSTSNITWKDIDWRPGVTLSQADPCDANNPPIDLPETYPVVHYRTYNKVVSLEETHSMSSTSSNAYRVWPNLSTNSGTISTVMNQTYQENLSAFLVVKSNGQAIQRAKIVLNKSNSSVAVYTVSAGGKVINPITSAYASTSEMKFDGAAVLDNEIYVEWYSNSSLLEDYLKNNTTVDLVDLNTSSVVSSNINHSIYQFQPSFAGDHYLHWGQFMWNDLDRVANDPINPGDVKAPTEDIAEANNLSSNTSSPSQTEMDGMFSGGSALNTKFAPLVPKRGEDPVMVRDYIIKASTYSVENPASLDRYITSHSHSGLYGNDGLASPWLFVQADLNLSTEETLPTGDDIAVAVPLTTASKTLAVNYAAGANIQGTFPLNIDMTYSNEIVDHTEYYNETNTQMMDVNGDGIPDLWVGSQTDIHLSDPRGGMSPSPVNLYAGRKSNSYNAFSASIGAGSSINEDNKFLVFDQQQSQLVGVQQLFSVGSSASYSMGKQHRDVHWTDFNGDGLPDRVEEGSSSTSVAFGNGSDLSSVVSYPIGDVSETMNNTINLALSGSVFNGVTTITDPKVLEYFLKGVKTKNNSFAVGLGINRTSSFSDGFFMDVNGDGLADRIEEVNPTDNQYVIYLNKGVEFTSQAIPLSVLPGYFNQNASLGINANGSATAGFPIIATPFGNFKGSVNGAYSYAFSTSLTRSSFTDLNSDGKVDLVTTDVTGNLEIFHNQSGKALKLETVKNPLGGHFTLDYKVIGNKHGYYTAEITSHNSPSDEDVFWDMPNGKWVLASVEIYDGYDFNDGTTDLDGADYTRFSYHYDGGVKSRREKDFIGFSRIEKRYDSYEYPIAEHLAKPITDPQYLLNSNCFSVVNGYPYVERFYSEVQFFEALLEDDPDERKIYEYQKDVLTDHFYFLNYIVHKKATTSESEDPECPTNLVVEEQDFQRHLISHKENRYDWYQVATSGTNLGEVDLDDNQDLKPVNFGAIGENSAVFPALTNTITYVHPEIDTTQVFHGITPISVSLLQATKYSADYDRYFNVIQYRQGYGSAEDVYTETVEKTVNYVKIEEQSAVITLNLQSGVTITNPFDPSTTPTEIFTTRYAIDLPLGGSIEISDPSALLYLPESFRLEEIGGQYFVTRVNNSSLYFGITDLGYIISNPSEYSAYGPINSNFLPDMRAYILVGPSGFENDTLLLPMYLTNNSSNSCGLTVSEVVLDIPVTFRKVENKTIQVIRRELSTTINFDLIADMEYFPPNQVEGLTGFLKKHEVREGSSANPPSRRTHAVHGDGTSNKKWQIHEIRNELVGQATNNLAITNFSHDTYGNVTSLQGPHNHQGQRLTVSYTYDSYLHQNIIGVSNSFGESVCNIYSEDGNNLLEQSTDVNKHPIRYVYDTKNRLTEVYGPEHLYTSGAAPTISFEYHEAGINQATNAPYEQTIPVAFTYHNINESAQYTAPGTANYCTQKVDVSARPSISDPLRTATFVDGLGQVVQVKKDVSWNDAGVYTGNIEVSGFGQKNIYSWPTVQRLSFLDISTASGSLTDLGEIIIRNSQIAADVEYDYLGRKNRILTPTETQASPLVETILNYSWDNGKNLFYHEVLSPEDQDSRSYMDAIGRQLELWRGETNDWEVTKFTYDQLGQLESYISPALSETKYVYDAFGRVVSENHPDRGTTTNEYDRASNLIKVTNQAGEFVAMTYNWNRITSKTFSRTGAVNNLSFTYGTLGDGKNGAGRVVSIVQGTNFKTEEYQYDLLGNLVEEKKTITIPQAGPQEFVTSFDYDAWGRILEITYPDDEVVSYGYNGTGDLISMVGQRPGYSSHTILSAALYDGFGNMSSYTYGNNAVTNLSYSTVTRRLTNAQVQLNFNGSAQDILNKSFTYDDQGSIASVINTAVPITNASGSEIGGAYSLDNIGYDSRGQLAAVDLKYGNTSAGLSGTLQHNITITGNFEEAGRFLEKKTYDNTSMAYESELYYVYGNTSIPHRLTQVQDHSVPGNESKTYDFEYNAMGSITKKTYTETLNSANTVLNTTEFCWTEEQQLSGVLVKDEINESASAHHYLYDQNGIRIMKTNMYIGTVGVNSNQTNSVPIDVPTVYANAYFIATHYDEVVLGSKHYYMGAQRIASNLISYPFDHEDPNLEALRGEEGQNGYSPATDGAWQDLNATLQCLYDDAELSFGGDMLYLQSIGEESIVFDDGEGGEIDPTEIDATLACEQSLYWANLAGVSCSEVELIYFYHPDYLGSVEFVSDMRGEPYQYFLNTPWGENLENQFAHNYTSFSSRFRFNGKEWDEETGNFYYGARYYDPRISVWLSVDPLAGKYPSLSPYAFVANNPIMLVDPDGRQIEFSEETSFFNKVRFILKQWNLNRKSETAKTQWQTLKASDHVHTIHVNEVSPNGKVETATFAKGSINSETGNGTDIYINLNEKSEDGSPIEIGIGHEEAHSYRFDQGLVESDIRMTLDGSVTSADIIQHNDSRRVTEEREASHIENVIRAEFDPNQRRFGLRTHYRNIPQHLVDPLTGMVYDVIQIDINVIKPGYEYYKK